MSEYLGFTPSDRPNYFFVSYNNEDAGRVGNIAKSLFHNNLPLWYDHGIEYGEKWENKLSGKILNSQAVILFLTKGILFKENSYVQKEYKMATEYFNKKVYVVLMDKIENNDIPYNKVPWWIDIQENQCIDIIGINDMEKIVSIILTAVGLSSHQDKMNSLIEKYKDLHMSGKVDEAESYLADYLQGVSLSGKAELIAHLYDGNVAGLSSKDISTDIHGRLSEPLLNHTGHKVESFHECQKLTINTNSFTVGNSFVFHRGTRGDAHVINIWKDKELIYTLGGLIEAYGLLSFYDENDNILYICSKSEKEDEQNGTIQIIRCINVITIESPTKDAICNKFVFSN